MQYIADIVPTASRLLAELMPVSVVVAGARAETFAQALQDAGAAAVTLEAAVPADLFDLAVLLADVADLDLPQTRATIAALSGLSERLLFVPAATGEAEGPALSALTAWFEPLAEFGYQPVVDFDAQFVARGAFLVDRSATAAESDLASFADRVSGGAAASAPPPAPPPPPDPAEAVRRDAEASALAEELAGLRRQLAASASAESQLRSALAAAEAQNAGWDGLRTWVARRVLSEAKTLEALRAARADIGVASRRGFFRHRPTAEERALLAEAALLRACPLFDPAWYVAATPEVASSGADPLLHFLLVGGPAGRDPGPWFETAAYVAANPRAAAERIPLLHAIRTGVASPPPMPDTADAG